MSASGPAAAVRRDQPVDGNMQPGRQPLQQQHAGHGHVLDQGLPVAAMLAALLAIAVPLFASYGLHKVPEGYVGVYWRGGALINTTAGPGFHLRIPWLTVFEPMQVTLQTDKVTNIPCGTKGGVMIYFEKIEVVNRLNRKRVLETVREYGVHYDKTWIYDKIHHEINQFCSSHSLQDVYIDLFDQVDERMREALQRDCDIYAPGIEIISVRVTKPTIPGHIKDNYELMENERTKACCTLHVLIAAERQRNVEKEAETARKKAVMEAEKEAETSSIRMRQQIMEKESAKQMAEIEDTMYLARQKSLADAQHYQVLQETEANRMKLTPEYLELAFIQAIANNTKMFFGEKVPGMLFDQRLLGNVLHQN
eukprot:jgi/Chlat1/8219/Chrsp76S07638